MSYDSSSDSEELDQIDNLNLNSNQNQKLNVI